MEFQDFIKSQNKQTSLNEGIFTSALKSLSKNMRFKKNDPKNESLNKDRRIWEATAEFNVHPNIIKDVLKELKSFYKNIDKKVSVSSGWDNDTIEIFGIRPSEVKMIQDTINKYTIAATNR